MLELELCISDPSSRHWTPEAQERLLEQYTERVASHNKMLRDDPLHADSGFDLIMPRGRTIGPNSSVLINLRVRAALYEIPPSRDSVIRRIPRAYQIFPRSSMSKTPLRLANSVGIIDAGYRGELMAAIDSRNCHGHDNKVYVIISGQRLLQICAPGLVPFHVVIVNELDETNRGGGGFGSTGK